LFEVLSDQGVSQRRGMAVVVDQLGVEVALATVLVVIEDLAEIDEVGLLLGSDFTDHPVDAEP
tara:strand:+ start:373 stop:561 length:189 start_codon:yes stop_codon:yes gene_type:complete